MMRTVARYQPAIDLSAWIRSATTTRDEIAAAREANLRLLGGDVQWATAVEYGNARQALHAYFWRLAAAQPGAEVLFPAQICCVAIEAVRLAGLIPRFVDGDGSYPTPTARQYSKAMTPKTAAIVVSPLYGYLQDDWRLLRDLRGDWKLLLDLAQGLTLFNSLSTDLVERADAVVYSFAIGKGIDTGGGLLLARAVSDGDLAPDGAPAAGVGTLMKSIVLRAAIASGVYGAFVDRLESASEAAKADRESFVPRRLHPAMHFVWQDKMRRFRREVVLARARAAEFVASDRLRALLRDLDIYCDSRALHLRQIVRLRNAAQRDRAVVRLRESGIDCAAAGEPLPPEGDFPNARAFVSDAIRLPFLGRLSEPQFAVLKRNLEIAIDERLSS